MQCKQGQADLAFPASAGPHVGNAPDASSTPASLFELQNQCANRTQEVGLEPDLQRKSCSQSLCYKSFTEARWEPVSPGARKWGSPTHRPISTPKTWPAKMGVHSLWDRVLSIPLPQPGPGWDLPLYSHLFTSVERECRAFQTWPIHWESPACAHRPGKWPCSGLPRMKPLTKTSGHFSFNAKTGPGLCSVCFLPIWKVRLIQVKHPNFWYLQPFIDKVASRSTVCPISHVMC